VRLIFVTSNRHKFEEAVKLFPSEVELHMQDINCPEIQSDFLEEIAKKSAEYAFSKLGKTLFVTDAGLFVHSLKKFPGPYSSYVLRTIGCEGILKLMEGVGNREAYFKSFVAYADAGGIRTFEGVVKGTISHEIRGNSGFGYDPIFIPEGRTKTFAEDYEYKQKVSHRTRALRKLILFLSSSSQA
jgi:XTP/dITP diphosphohydrolase